MGEGTNEPAAPQAGATAAPGGQSPATPQAGATNPPTGTQAQKSADEYERIIADLRKENAGHRTKLTAFEKSQQEAEAASLTDLQKLQRQHEAVSKQAEAYRAKLAGMAVQFEAQRLGIVDPEVAATLIAGRLELDADGSPTNAEALLKDLVKAKPYLLAQAGGGAGQQQASAATAGGATNPSRSGTNGGAKVPLSHDYIEQLIATNTTEYVARGPEIRAWLLANPRRGRH